MADEPEYYLLEISKGYEFFNRSDSSVELRNKLYSGWEQGQQLWDVDMNNNFTFGNWWTVPTVYNWKEPWAPWPSPYTKIYIDHEYGIKGIVQQTHIKTIIPPIVGGKVYSLGDRIMIGYSVDQVWKAMFYAQHFNPEAEISLFAYSPDNDVPCAGHVFERGFRLYKQPGDSRIMLARYRCSRNEHPAISIRKNGEEIATARMLIVSWRVSQVLFSPPYNEVDYVDFAPGDVLTLVAPVVQNLQWLSLSLLGEALSE